MHCHWGCSLLHGRSQVSSPSLAHEEGETAHYLHNRCIGHTPATVRLGLPLCTLHADQDASLLQVPTCHRRPRYRFAAMGDQNGKWSGPKSTTRFDSECVRSLPRRLHPPASAVAPQTRIPFLLPTLGQKDSKHRCDAYASLPCKWLSGGHSATVAFALSFYNRLYEGAHRRGVIILVISRSDHKSCPALLLW